MPKIPGINHRNAIGGREKAGVRVIREGKHIVIPMARASSPSLARTPSTLYTCADQ